jgi:hypothetical protein
MDEENISNLLSIIVSLSQAPGSAEPQISYQKQDCFAQPNKPNKQPGEGGLNRTYFPIVNCQMASIGWVIPTWIFILKLLQRSDAAGFETH